ncbi:DciA family protein [Corynebacterium alimapuense]|uniref:DUF721 domain-containing protein n=1 Tax=Corynebacterium alimapuense TaxID=1576874 RepID=A0A3M8K4I5_9CORY|nr:DciA family protein [Corynebacterium alimapuense]RNE48133.1 hypothetical protein C5L39_09660 [Corynebacterium alimapuense]
MADPVDDAFENMRKAAAQRNGGKPPVARKTPPAKKATGAGYPGIRRRGIPSAMDGRRRRPLEVSNVGSLIGGEIRRRGWSQGIAGGWVYGNWDELVGEKIAQHTRVEMVKDKTVFITCDSTAWATNLRMMQRQILQAIAEKVGPNMIVELKIFGPKAPSWRKGPLHVKGRGPRDTYG